VTPYSPIAGYSDTTPSLPQLDAVSIQSRPARHCKATARTLGTVTAYRHTQLTGERKVTPFFSFFFFFLFSGFSFFCSLQITPCCNLPLKALKNGGQFAIVNLQKTPKDRKATVTVAERVDKVRAQLHCVCSHLSLCHCVTVPLYHFHKAVVTVAERVDKVSTATTAVAVTTMSAVVCHCVTVSDELLCHCITVSLCHWRKAAVTVAERRHA